MRVSQSVVIPILVSVCWLVMAAGSTVPALMSVMIFDAPGSEDNGLVWWLVGSLCAFPVLCLVSAGGVWIGWLLARRVADRRPELARLAVVLPAVLPLAAVASGLLALGTLQLVCDGSFSCS